MSASESQVNAVHFHHSRTDLDVITAIRDLQNRKKLRRRNLPVQMNFCGQSQQQYIKSRAQALNQRI